MTVSLMLVDDHAILREGLRAILDSEPGFNVIGETGDGLQALTLVEKLQPDVLILDMMIPGLSGIEVVRQAGRRAPKTRIVVLSMYKYEAYVVEALRHGAMAYVLKGSGASELIQAIRVVMAGDRFLSASLSEDAIQSYIEKAREDEFDPYETLTNRERQVFHMAAEGLTNADIGARLVISQRTVEIHRARAMRKLGLTCQAELIRFAIRRGFLPLDE